MVKVPRDESCLVGLNFSLTFGKILPNKNYFLIWVTKKITWYDTWMKIINLGLIMSMVALSGCKTEKQSDGIVELKDSDLVGIAVEGKFGFQDKQGVIRIPARFENVGQFSEGLAKVQVDQTVGYINTMGNMVIKLPYDIPYFNRRGYSYQALWARARDFKEGLAAVILFVDDQNSPNGKIDRWGYIDRQGKVSIPPKYSTEGGDIIGAGDFSEGLAAVNFCFGGMPTFGYIDSNGTVVISPKYSSASPFKNGLAQVTMGFYEFTINKKGEIINEKK